MLHFHSHCSNTPPGVISTPQRTHNGVGIIITTFAGNSFPNRWCKSASLLLRMFCCCIFQRIQEGLFCLHMPMLPCVETSWIRVFPQLQKGKRAFTWQCYMWEHKRHLPFCNASSTGKQERTQLRQLCTIPQGLSVQVFSCAAPTMSSKLCFIEFEQEMSREA